MPPAKKAEEKKPDGAKDPFAFADFSWVPGNAGSSEKPLSAIDVASAARLAYRGLGARP